jgi:hypothetical protein
MAACKTIFDHTTTAGHRVSGRISGQDLALTRLGRLPRTPADHAQRSPSRGPAAFGRRTGSPCVGARAPRCWCLLGLQDPIPGQRKPHNQSLWHGDDTAPDSAAKVIRLKMAVSIPAVLNPQPTASASGHTEREEERDCMHAYSLVCIQEWLWV